MFSPDAPVVLTPGVTPKIKKERTDKIYQHSEMMRYLTKPKPTEQEIQDTEFWKAYNNSEKMVAYINKYGAGPEIKAPFSPKKYPVTPEHYTDRIEDRKQKAINKKTTKGKIDGQV